MREPIITGYVETTGGRDALELGTVLADLDPAGVLVVARVYAYAPPPAEPTPREGWPVVLEEAAQATLVSARERCGGRPRTTFVPVRALSPAEGLHRIAAERTAAAVVVGVSHEHGLGRIVPGSVTEQTLHGSPCAVAVAPNGWAERSDRALRTVAVAFNGSAEAERALGEGVAIARTAGARLRIVGVAEHPVVWGGIAMSPVLGADGTEWCREMLAGAAGRASGIEHVETQCLEGDAARAIRDATADVDLLVVGSRGHGPVRRVLLGSVTARLVRDPPCAMFVIPRSAVATDLADDASGALGAASS